MDSVLSLPRTRPKSRKRKPFGPREKKALAIVTIWCYSLIVNILVIVVRSDPVVVVFAVVIIPLYYYRLEVKGQVWVLKNWWDSNAV